MSLHMHSSCQDPFNLLALVSHDLKSPINAIMGLADQWRQRLDLESEPPDRAELRTDFQILYDASQDMLMLINHALAAVRIESGKGSIECHWESDLEWMIRRIADTFRLEAASSRISIQIEVPSELPSVCWDLQKIRFHVINNLVSNALKFGRSGGVVRVAVEQVDEVIVIKVADDGPGIPPSERSKVFDRFQMGEVKSQRAFKGTGLGLYCAKLFVELHGGEISIHDGLDGRGVTFQLSIPRCGHMRSHSGWSAATELQYCCDRSAGQARRCLGYTSCQQSPDASAASGFD